MNKNYKKVYYVLLIAAMAICCSQDISLAAAEVATNSGPITMKQAAIKFLMVMGGVLLSSVILYIGLTIYNKIRGSKHIKNIKQANSELGYNTPTTKQDAINLFINQNRL